MTSVIIDRRTGLKASAAIKAPVLAATTANTTLTGEQTIDGVALVDGDRVLVKSQSDATENGLYLVSSGNWSRSPDFRDAADITKGTQVFVTGGTISANRTYAVTNSGTITIGTTELAFELSDNVAASADNADLAQRWAEEDYNVVVEGGGYSAKHWATVAQASAGSGVAGVASFNSRTGAVSPASGDYAISDVTGLTSALAAKLAAATTVSGGNGVTISGTLAGDDLTISIGIRGYLYGLTATNNSSDASNDIDFAAGACAADTSPFYLMELSALTKRLDATWAVGNNQGMLDTGSVANTTYYLYAIQRSDTLVTDFLASTSASAPTMPTNYDRKRLIGSLVRSGGVNGVPFGASSSGGSSSEITLSGSQYDISGIPSSATEIDLVLYEVSLSAGVQMNIQLGSSGGVEVTGYKSSNSGQSTTGTGASSSTDGFRVSIYSTATGPYSGVIKFHRVGSTNKWVADGHVKTADSAGAISNISGSKELSGALDRIRITSVTGSPTLSGSAQIKWR